jgi:hypothetical protein
LLSLRGVVSPSLLIHGGVGLDHVSGQAKALAKPHESGYMITVEFATCRVPDDPVSPALAVGYVMACTTFYEREFNVPSHQFLCCLLEFYSLELHHLTPSGMLHMVAFVTLCVADMGIEPHSWNYFFHARLQQGSHPEAVVLGSVDIFVRYGPGFDPYFCLPMSDPMSEAESMVLF